MAGRQTTSAAEKTTVIFPPDVWSGDHNKPILCLEPLAVGAEDAARLLGISRPTLYTLLNREDFPSFRVGNRVLISVAGLREWINQQTKAVAAQ